MILSRHLPEKNWIGMMMICDLEMMGKGGIILGRGIMMRILGCGHQLILRVSSGMRIHIAQTL